MAGATLLVVRGPEAVTSGEAAAAEDAYDINKSQEPARRNRMCTKFGLITPKV